MFKGHNKLSNREGINVKNQVPKMRSLGKQHYAAREGSPSNSTKTISSILCVTHQMSRKKRNYSVDCTVPYEKMNYKWYLMVLGQYMTILAGTWQYKLVLLDNRWYMVSKGLVCLYILERVEIWLGVTDA